MKKIILSICFILILGLLTGCGQKEGDGDEVTPTPQPTVPVEDTTPDDTEDTTNGNDTENGLTVKDYFPLQPDTEYVYEGEGNEYAAYRVFVDYIDLNRNLIQTRTDNGGTEMIKLIEIKNGKLSLLKSIGEAYYRDNLFDTPVSEDKIEVLLMEPLVKGTEWTLPDNRKRYISSIEVNIETPLGNFIALEVITEGTDFQIKDYYAPNVGLIKSIFTSGESEVSSTLSEAKTDAIYSKVVEFYYPNQDGKIYINPKTLTFRTNDITRKEFQNAVKEIVNETYLPLSSQNTEINTLYLGNDNIVYVDFSKEFITEMNVGAEYETLILQSITNTLGNYYSAQEVYITVENNPYESGHIAQKKGETFKVDMDKVVN